MHSTAHQAAQGDKMVKTPEELGAWLRLALTPGVGPESARRLLAAFGEPQAIFAQTETALSQVVSA
jgi:DNA processing protein